MLFSLSPRLSRTATDLLYRQPRILLLAAGKIEWCSSRDFALLDKIMYHACAVVRCDPVRPDAVRCGAVQGVCRHPRIFWCGVYRASKDLYMFEPLGVLRKVFSLHSFVPDLFCFVSFSVSVSRSFDWFEFLFFRLFAFFYF